MIQDTLWGAAEGSPGRRASSLTRWQPDSWQVAADWRSVTEPFFASNAGQRLGQFVQARLDAGAVVYPPEPLRALALTALADVRIVILGQDPYHGSGQAEGLAFSVASAQKIPPSLRNIFKELQRDLDLPPATNGSLVRWARQGVLLLNTILTVEDGCPCSHAQRGWEVLTDAIIQCVAQSGRPVVFMLWGAHAQSKRGLIEASSHDERQLILAANHPSPLSARRPPVPFLGCGHFRKANEFVADQGSDAVIW